MILDLSSNNNHKSKIIKPAWVRYGFPRGTLAVTTRLTI